MNFDFSDDLNQVRTEPRSFLREYAAGSARRAMEQKTGFDAALLGRTGALGWLGAAIPEIYGGMGLGEKGLCVIAEEVGASLAAIS